VRVRPIAAVTLLVASLTFGMGAAAATGETTQATRAQVHQHTLATGGTAGTSSINLSTVGVTENAANTTPAAGPTDPMGLNAVQINGRTFYWSENSDVASPLGELVNIVGAPPTTEAALDQLVTDGPPTDPATGQPIDVHGCPERGCR
jgi:hypothetical protein